MFGCGRNALDDIQQATDRLAKLAWMMENHVQWGWQREDPDRLGEHRTSDHGALQRWEAEIGKKVNQIIDRYLARLQAREDRISPHGSAKPSAVSTLPTPKPAQRCPGCGTELRVGGTI